MARFLSKKSKELTKACSEFEFQKNFLGLKSFVDWKSPDNRTELFNRYFKWRVLAHDLDHTHYMGIMCKDYDYEKRAWYALTFGMTYRTPQSFAYVETFPDFHATTLDEIEKWHAVNWKRTTYGTDARYNKGHFHKQCTSIKEWLNGKTFQQKFDSILVYDTENKNFWALYTEILKLYKYGRMTGWLTMQALHDLLDLPIDPDDIMLDGFSPNNDSSLQSIWNGLCAYTNQHNNMVGGKYGNYVCTSSDVAWAKESLLEYTALAEEYSGFKIDSFRKESIWCQYKRLFNEGMSKEYPGHASGDATSRYLYYRNNWPEIDWSKFRESLRAQPGLVKGTTFVDWYNQVFSETGLLINMHELFDDMPNAYKLIGEDPNKYKVREIWEDDNLPVPVVDSEHSSFKLDLNTTPKWYENSNHRSEKHTVS